MKKRIIMALSISIALFASASIGAYAATNLEQIEAYLNKSLKINLNGDALDLVDSTGSQVYPITYEGTTYLPARLISEALGMKVDFNSDENTVYIGGTNTDIHASNNPDGQQETRGIPSTVTDVAAAKNKNEYITLNYANLIKSYPGAVDMKATDRTFVRLSQDWQKDSTGSALTLWVKVASLVPLVDRENISFRLVTSNEELAPTLLQIDPQSEEKEAFYQYKDVMLDIVFSLPDGINPGDCILRMYDGKDHVDLKLVR